MAATTTAEATPRDTAVTAFLILLAYAAGAIPWGVVLGRWFVHTDLRRHGSGGTGATNAWRVLGWRISLAVFALDFLKGFVPVIVARWAGLDDWAVTVIGVGAVVGHCWSPFIRFRGGKGMAAGAGACAAIFPWVLAVFPLMVLVSRSPLCVTRLPSSEASRPAPPW